MPSKNDERPVVARVITPIVAVFAATSALALGGCGGTSYSADHPSPQARTFYRDASFVIDSHDKVQLAQWADEIFTGTVKAKVGTDNYVEGLPTTEYEVAVEEVVEGSPPAVVTVAQQGGYSEDGKTLDLFEGDELFRPGETRLFAATLVDGERLVFPVQGSEELETSAEEARLVDAYEVAADRAEVAPLPEGLQAAR